MVRLFALLVVTSSLIGCLPATSYTPRSPGKVALGMRGGKLALIKNGDVAGADRYEAVVGCDREATKSARASRELFRSSERNATVAGVFNALTIIFPLAPAIGTVFVIRANRQEQEATAAIVDAINQHNDARHCVVTTGPGSALGESR